MTKAASKPMLNVTILFRKEKETPGTFAYKQVDKDGYEERSPVGTLYLKKDALRSGVPEMLHVTIVGE